jgi:hypothetical protein
MKKKKQNQNRRRQGKEEDVSKEKRVKGRWN